MQGGLISHLSFTSSKIKGSRDVDKLETELCAIDGVQTVNVDPNAHTVEVDYDPTVVNESKLRTTMEDAGYRPE
jgi:copper chaperone CopZ